MPGLGFNLATMNMTTNDSAGVVQLRVVVEVDDFDAAIAFYRDALGLPEEMAFESEGEARVAILEAGRATLEIANPAQKRMIDQLETGEVQRVGSLQRVLEAATSLNGGHEPHARASGDDALVRRARPIAAKAATSSSSKASIRSSALMDSALASFAGL